MNNPFPPSADPLVISGLAIPFGGKDLDGEYFDSETDLHLSWFEPDQGRPILYHHGLNAETGVAVVGRQTALKITAEGAWIEAQLDARSRYVARIQALLARGALGFSSGAMGHLARTLKDGRIVSWPWVETSLTVSPANARAVVYAVKSTAEAIAHIGAAGTRIPVQLRELQHVDATQGDMRAIAGQADIGSARGRKRHDETILAAQRSLARIDAARQAELRAIAAKADAPELQAMARARHAERERQKAEKQRRDDAQLRDWSPWR